MKNSKKKPAVKRTRVSQKERTNKIFLILIICCLLVLIALITVFVMWYILPWLSNKKNEDIPVVTEVIDSEANTSENKDETLKTSNDEKEQMDSLETSDSEMKVQGTIEKKEKIDQHSPKEIVSVIPEIEKKLSQLFIVNLTAIVNSNVSEEERINRANIIGERTITALPLFPVSGLILNDKNLIEPDDGNEQTIKAALFDFIEKYQVKCHDLYPGLLNEVPVFIGINEEDLSNVFIWEEEPESKDLFSLNSKYHINLFLCTGENYQEIPESVLVIQKDDQGVYQLKNSGYDLRVLVLDGTEPAEEVAGKIKEGYDMIICGNSEFQMYPVIMTLQQMIDKGELTVDAVDAKLEKIINVRQKLKHKGEVGENNPDEQEMISVEGADISSQETLVTEGSENSLQDTTTTESLEVPSQEDKVTEEVNTSVQINTVTEGTEAISVQEDIGVED